MGKRPYRNEQTEKVAEYVFSNIDEALAYREQFLSEATEGFKYIGQGFINEIAKCPCGKAEGIDWNEIDEIFQYDLRTLIDSSDLAEEAEPEVEETVIEADLPEKTLEVADKIVDEVTDTQESEEDTEDIDKELE